LNPTDLDHALETGAHQPAPPKPPPYSSLGSALAGLDQAALNMAKTFGLLREDGTIACIKSCGGTGQLPSLECPRCRERRVGR
jgi:hypothetical protein